MKNKKILYIILSFIIPLSALITIFHIKGLFTTNTILSGDMHAQYYPLYNYLKELLNGTSSIFYTFEKGLGGTMFGTFFYYLSSPLNLLIIFVNKIDIPNFITLLIILKISLCGPTMYIYMNNKFKTNNLLLLALSICYSLMGFNINYFINIMWLDVVILTPLVLLGIDKIIENKSPVLYITTLFISICANYYMSYMLCIFCIIYLIYEIIIRNKEKKEIKQIVKKFLITSILTGLICSFFLIPCILEMTNYGRTVKLSEIFTLDYNYFDIFSKTYIGSLNINNSLNYSSMNLYCSIITLPLVYLYIINKNIPKKERIITTSIIILYILPCFVGILNYIFHLFTIPNFYSYRYSFLLCFFMILITYKSISNLNISIKKILFYLTFYSIISLYFIIITCFGNYYTFLNYKLIWITLIFLFTYFIILYFKKPKKLIPLIILIELILNLYLIFDTHDPIEKETLLNNDKKEIINKYKDENYRIESNYGLTYNDSILNKYSGITNFLSTTNNRTLRFIYEYGYNETEKEISNLYLYKNQNYILESILGLKYIISNNKYNNYKLIEQIKLNENDIYIYENPNELGFGFMIKDKCNIKEKNKLYNEQLLNCILDSDYKLYKENKQIEKDTYKIKKDDYYYVYMNNISETNFIALNEHIIDNLYYKSYDYLIYENKDQEKIKFKFDEEMDKSSFKVLSFDYKTFNSIKYNKLSIETKKDNYLKGIIDVKEKGILMINIPYEKGFNIYVNNNKVDYFKVMNTFIGITLEKGQNKIEIKYEQPGLKTGIIISSFSIILLCCYLKYDRKKNIYEKNI